MSKLAIAALGIVLAAGLTGCESMGGSGKRPTGQQIGTVGGAVAGGVVGSAATGGSTLGTIGGAIVGGAVGNELGDRHDDKKKR